MKSSQWNEERESYLERKIDEGKIVHATKSEKENRFNLAPHVTTADDFSQQKQKIKKSPPHRL